MELLASVVIPTYNQASRLRLTLESLRFQKTNSILYEVIVVDDGSNDETKEVIENYRNLLPLSYIFQDNQGRSTARNKGILHSKGRFILFLDSDRPVLNNWIENHVRFHLNNKNCIGIGDIKEFYFSNLSKHYENLFEDIKNNFSNYYKFSRNYKYWSVMEKTFDKNNKCSLNAPWLATMIGNLSVERELLIKIGLFDENFKSWGCEHFEIGYRFFKNMNLSFFRIIEAPSFHIAHRREEFFYENALKVSHNYFKSKHNDLSVQLLLPLLEGEITLGEFDTRLHKTPNNLNESINDVYVKNISRNN